MSAPQLAGSSEATAAGTLQDSRIEQALAKAKLALEETLTFSFKKFESVNVSTASFSGTSTFSLQDLRITIDMFGNEGLFEIPTESMLRSYPEALLRLHNALTKERSRECLSLLRGLSKKREHEVEYVLLKDLVSPLCGLCLVSEHGKSSEHLEKCSKTENLQRAHLGMGNTATWHGYLDAMAVPKDSPTVPLFVSDSLSEELEVEEKDEDEGDQVPALRSYPSSGAGCGMEIKPALAKSPQNKERKSQSYMQNINQAVAESIVFSTIHHNRHEDQQSLVPTIMLDSRSFIVVMYDCVSDVLLVSHKIAIYDDLGLSRSAVALLWMVLHHQAFLKERKEVKDSLTEEFSSGFQKACKRDGTESLYKGLKEYDQKSFATPEFPTAKVQQYFTVARKRKLSDM